MARQTDKQAMRQTTGRQIDGQILDTLSGEVSELSESGIESNGGGSVWIVLLSSMFTDL